MKRLAILYTLFCLFLITGIACVKPFEPEVITSSTDYLVVDGIINCAPNGITNVKLTRTRKLSDTVTAQPELQALVFIESENGNQYALQEKDSGQYLSAPLTLNTSQRYRLLINSGSGNTYISDFVPVTLTPAIDSVNWKQNGATVSIYVNTHDPFNNTRYYRWEYDETWEHHAYYESFLKLENDRVAYRDSSELTYACWQTARSTDILQLSSASLSQDVIEQALLTSFSAQSPKFEVRYSINVKQFALSKEAYEYWQILKRNTQQLGSIFDAQPSQLIGNLHNASKQDEPVIGYITAASVTEKRMFISRMQITNPYRPQSDCTVKIIPTDSAAYYLKTPLTALGYYVGSGGGAVAITATKCVDCTLAGGVPQRPLFW